MEQKRTRGIVAKEMESQEEVVVAKPELIEKAQRNDLEPITTPDGKMIRVRYLTLALQSLYSGDGGMGWMELEKAERGVKNGICEIIMKKKEYKNKMMTSEAPQKAPGMTWNDLYGNRVAEGKKLKAFEAKEEREAAEQGKPKELGAFKGRTEADNTKTIRKENELRAFAGRE